MELTKTIILKIANKDLDLVGTMQRYAQGMNYVSKFVYANRKSIAAMKLQRKTYQHLRNTLKLKSQVSCNIPRQVAGAYKTLQEQIYAEMTEWQLLTFKPSSMTLSYKRDFDFNEDTVNITTLSAGRKPYRILNYEYAKQFFDGSWLYTASKICLHKDGYCYLHLGLQKHVDVPKLEDAKKFMGVDIGMNYLAVAATINEQCFFDGRRIKDLRNRYCGMRARLQSKGTLSAKRILRRLSGKEKRLMRSVNHAVSKKVVAYAKQKEVDVIGLEDLNGIRKRTVVRQSQRYWHSSWAFRELQGFIEYKAVEAGIKVVYVDGSYTSQECPCCGHISRNNRHRLCFKCEMCGYSLNADLNGARNIERRTRDFRYILESQGLLSAAHTDACSMTSKPCPSGQGS